MRPQEKGLSASDVLITPDGKTIFAGIRGSKFGFDWVARYGVLNNGEVELLGLTKADAVPWGFCLSPDGRYLLVTATGGASLTAYRIREGGNLTKAARLAIPARISDIAVR